MNRMNTTKIAIIGYGLLGKQIASMASYLQPNHEVYVFDDIASGVQCDKFTNPMAACFDEQYEDCQFYVCLGYKHLVRKLELIETLLRLGRCLPSIICPSSYRSPSSEVAPGAIVYPMCNLDQNSVIGKGALIHNSVVVSHDSEIGDCAYLSPGCVLAGQVTVGSCVFMGAGVLVANGVKIGSHARVGIGTVVTSNVPSGASVIGNPMRVLEKSLKVA